MPKVQSKKRNNASGSGGQYAAKPAASNNVFQMNKDQGQHVLKNPGVAQAIVEKADLKQSDVVLEVGPGTGNLSARILEKCKRLIAVETDPRMAAEMTKRFQGKPEQRRLDVLLGDVVKTNLPYFDVCISNTPYQISSPLTFKLLATSPSPRVCILMFQREFAMRLIAKPGDKLYGRLSVNSQMWAKIDHIMKVGKNNFKPPPAVESNVVRIVPKSPRPQISYDEWDGLLRICFVRKNKTLRASFFGTTSVMDLLESNYRTWCAQNDISIEDGPSDSIETMDVEQPGGEEDLDDDMEIDEEGELPHFLREEATERAKDQENRPKRKKKGKVFELVREKVRKVLEQETELADRRARQCNEGDFLRLLFEFNKQGIHFS